MTTQISDESWYFKMLASVIREWQTWTCNGWDSFVGFW